jgi:hypothetical protein
VNEEFRQHLVDVVMSASVPQTRLNHGSRAKAYRTPNGLWRHCVMTSTGKNVVQGIGEIG